MDERVRINIQVERWLKETIDIVAKHERKPLTKFIPELLELGLQTKKSVLKELGQRYIDIADGKKTSGRRNV